MTVTRFLPALAALLVPVGCKDKLKHKDPVPEEPSGHPFSTPGGDIYSPPASEGGGDRASGRVQGSDGYWGMPVGTPEERLCADFDDDGICRGDGPGEDCNDVNPFIPSEEVCDGVDNDCDHLIDEELPDCDPAELWRREEPREVCDLSPPVAENIPLAWSCLDDATRRCGTCDYGEQICEGGVWGACDFQPPADGLEACACHQRDEMELGAGFLFILDTSGSMGDPYANGEQKYAAAVAGINEILNTYGGRADFGILAFPTDWSCTTEPPQVPIGGDIAAIRDILDRFGPGGQTPLGRSIQLGQIALEEYRNNHPDKQPAAIIISDGGETCGGNPVGALNNLLSTGIQAYLLDSSGGVLDDVGAALNAPQQVYDVTNQADLLAALDDILTDYEISVPYLEEVCNGADDDCDGRTDEGFQSFRYEGRAGSMGVGVCGPEEFDCVDGNIEQVNAGATPSQEVCDEVDNDCDGGTDECFRLMEACKWWETPAERLANPCSQRLARTTCGEDGESVICLPPVPAQEICNGLDDDCDHVIDNVAEGECGVPAEGEGEGVVEVGEGEGEGEGGGEGEGVPDRPHDGAVRWSFDAANGQMIPDESGHGREGELRGAFGGLPVLDAGVFGSALHCDGTEDYLQTPNAGLLGIADTYSISFWVFAEELRPAAQTLVALGRTEPDPNLNTRNYLEIIPQGDGTVIIQYLANDRTYSSFATVAPALTAGAWHHVVFTKGAQNNLAGLALYVDGAPQVLQGAQNFSPQADDGDRFITLCRQAETHNRYFRGKIDEFVLYDFAMTPREAADECRRDDPGGICH